MNHSSHDSLSDLIKVSKNDHEKRIDIYVSGTLQRDDVVALLDEVKKLQPQQQVYTRLYDFSEVDIEVSVQEFEGILSHAQKLFKVPGVVYKAAFVTSDPFVRQLAELYKSASRPYGFNDIECFASRRAALNWLNEQL
ncbi:MAG: STAS/SEC14 domain-containing protein [Gammaproteobacteria bacterium]|nr:STAS/SEC14 domain-containing protein [Gammaproteobacteria bacterium]NVK86702.1 STAS/SEC14 domain-containing protein [Gammaproteobacteria bacterium]